MTQSVCGSDNPLCRRSFLKKTRRITVAIVIRAVLLSCVLLGCSRDNGEVASRAVEAASPGAEGIQPQGRQGKVASSQVEVGEVRIVLVVSSETCQCALEKSAENRKYLTETVHKFGLGSNLDVVDSAKEEEKAGELLRKYRVHFIPSLLVLDGDGEVLLKNEWDVDRIAFEKLLANMVEKG